DGASDGSEYNYDSDPTVVDTDGDGMWDGYEINYFNINPTYANDANIDYDDDGLTNLEEFELAANVDLWGLNADLAEWSTQSTSPTSIDTDGDTMPDGYEVGYIIPTDIGATGLNPRSYELYNDNDLDGFDNETEYNAGTDPTDPASTPVVEPPETPEALTLILTPDTDRGTFKPTNCGGQAVPVLLDSDPGFTVDTTAYYDGGKVWVNLYYDKNGNCAIDADEWAIGRATPDRLVDGGFGERFLFTDDQDQTVDNNISTHLNLDNGFMQGQLPIDPAGGNYIVEVENSEGDTLTQSFVVHIDPGATTWMISGTVRTEDTLTLVPSALVYIMDENENILGVGFTKSNFPVGSFDIRIRNQGGPINAMIGTFYGGTAYDTLDLDPTPTVLSGSTSGINLTVGEADPFTGIDMIMYDQGLLGGLEPYDSNNLVTFSYDKYRKEVRLDLPATTFVPLKAGDWHIDVDTPDGYVGSLVYDPGGPYHQLAEQWVTVPFGSTVSPDQDHMHAQILYKVNLETEHAEAVAGVGVHAQRDGNYPEGTPAPLFEFELDEITNWNGVAALEMVYGTWFLDFYTDFDNRSLGYVGGAPTELIFPNAELTDITEDGSSSVTAYYVDGYIVGTIYDSGGINPVGSGYPVRLTSSTTFNGESNDPLSESFEFNTETDDSGQFSFPVINGDWLLEAWSPDNLYKITPVVINVDTDGDEVVESPENEARYNEIITVDQADTTLVAVIVEYDLPTGTVVINNYATVINDYDVTLTLTCDDGVGGSGCYAMRLSNDLGSTYSDWIPFTSTYSWTLEEYYGNPYSYVRVQFQDNYGNVSDPGLYYIDYVDLDFDPPVITLEGDDPIYLNVNSAYVDDGATAWDDFSGTLTGSIVYGGTVDETTVGTYLLTYDVTDPAGNSATQVTRTVYVVDTTGPVISLLGDNPVAVQYNSVYNDAGATATDNFDLSLPAVSIDDTDVDTSTLGRYYVYFSVTDSEGNVGTAIRTVNVVDTTVPEITLLGSTPVTHEVNTPYSDAGATASDNYDGDLTSELIIGGLPLNAGTTGTKYVTYDVTDSNGNAAVQVQREVNVVDTTAPVITLIGDSPVDAEAGVIYNDAGATAWDNYDGDISGSIVPSGTVNYNSIGSYVLTYNVSDAATNAATPVTRTVNVVDTIAPVITLNGSDPVEIQVGDAYTDAGANASDSFNLALPLVSVDDSAVNTAVVGSYTVTYSVSDGYNIAYATRTVNVVDSEIPVISLSGSATLDHEVNTPYSDAGATASDNYDGDLTGELVIGGLPLNAGTTGTKYVTYDVTDSNGNAAVQVQREVNVVDTTAPVITLIGDDPTDAEAGVVYDDAGATAWDNYDGDLTGSIGISGSVNYNSIGSYLLTYDVSDAATNAATSVTRTVNVVDTIAPVIILDGNNPETVQVGDTYSDAGATADDSFVGDLAGSINTSGLPINTNVVGSYTVTYSVSDGYNVTYATRTVNVVDGEIPVITLAGSAILDHEVNTPYSDAGAMASDNYDGDLTNELIVSGLPLNAGTLGEKSVTYNVTDSNGNAAVPVTRTVNVVDTTAPVITLIGDSPVDAEAGVIYNDAGATALDNYDGDLTGAINVSGSVNYNSIGSYLLTYNVSDAANNAAAQVTRTVNVVDTIAPVITLGAVDPVSVPVGGTYTEAGATAIDSFEGSLTVSVDNSTVNTAVVGNYLVTYSASDSSGNETIETLTVHVVDGEIPVISLSGSATLDHEVNTTYSDDGATAWDDYDGDLTSEIVIGGLPVNTGLVDSYEVTYDVTDSNGNEAVQVTRTVNVVDTTAPVITLVGDDPTDAEAGVVYNDAGATALDNYDGDLTGSIGVSGSVNYNSIGSYLLTYDVSDAATNAATPVTRTVNVVDTIAPLITITGNNPETVQVGDSYSDAGATADDSFAGDLTGAINTSGDSINTNVVGSYTVTYSVSDGYNVTYATRTVNVVDGDIPVITLAGSAILDHEVNTPYSDAGATASDNYDGDLTSELIIGGLPLNAGTTGTKYVTYDVTDSNGNAAVQVQRQVNVVDTTAPVITLVGDDPVDAEAGVVYNDAGATALDNYDGDLTGSISVSGSVNYNSIGSYLLTYDVSDNATNAAAQVTRTVNVVDTIAPVIILVGNDVETVQVGDAYSDAGATAGDSFVGDLTGSINTSGLPVNTNVVGSYTVTYSVSDGYNVTYATRTVNVVDGDIPVITLEGSATQDHEVNTPYSDAGATASDNYDGDLTSELVIGGLPLNAGTTGTRYVTYDVTDSNGNAAVQVTRTVNVVDTTAPVITLVGDDPTDAEAGVVYVDAGATALDNYDGDISYNITTLGSVNYNSIGSYLLTYNVSDDATNAATPVTRTVNVVDTIAPVITVTGNNPETVQVGDAYTDAGATAEDSFAGDLTGAITTTGEVLYNTVGSYILTYSVSDGYNEATATRTINVVDSDIPVITLNGDAVVDVEVFSGPYYDAGASATDNSDGNLTSELVIVGLPVDTNIIGNNVITYDVTDSSGNPAVQVTRTVNVNDYTAPVISLIGEDSVDVEVFSGEYVDAGATATDNYDSSLPPVTIDTGAVDTSVLGEYTVYFSVSDVSGNVGTLTRTVNVIDTVSPVISLIGENPLTYEAGGTFDHFATVLANDNYDGDITLSVIVGGDSIPVPATVGVYNVTYDVFDNSGNAAAQVGRQVNVVDTTDPVVSPIGDDPAYHEIYLEYVDAGADAADNNDTVLPPVSIDISGVNINLFGSYTVNFSVTDANGNTGTATREVIVQDTTPPVISLQGDNPTYLEVFSSYTDSGASASDNYDLSLPEVAIDDSEVDTSKVGSYTVFFTVTDSNGNTGTETRTVEVIDSVAPVITLTGVDPVTFEAGSTFDVYSDIEVSDNYDTDLIDSLIVGGDIIPDPATVGSYDLTYNVADNSGNDAVQITRTVNVVDTTPPVITLIGSNPQTVLLNTGYVELGATVNDNNDADLSASLVIDATAVDATTMGSYSVYYNVTDGAGNVATQVVRTVTVSTLSMVSPIGGEIYESGSTYTVEWTAHPGAVRYNLHYFDADGTPIKIAGVGNVTSYSWNIPLDVVAESGKMFRVTAFDGADFKLGEAWSNNSFTIVPKPFSVITPNGGEIWTIGGVYTIQWAPHQDAVRYRLHYFDADNTPHTVGNVGAVSSLSWKVPADAVPESGKTFRVSAFDASDAKVGEVWSEGTFTFEPDPYVMIAPVPGATWNLGVEYTIQWGAHPDATRYNIHYFDADGTPHVVQKAVTATSYNWTVPYGTSVEDGKMLRITAFNAVNAKLGEAWLDGTFNVGPAFAMTTPSGGEVWSVGNPYTVEWSIHPLAVRYNLHYFDADNTPHTVAVLGDVTSYDWTIPAGASIESGKRLRVTAFDGSDVKVGEAWSEGTFSVVP
ncbi:MAG: hypothetical protein C0615_08025, partial [Desulfuromonas sp.]